MEPPDHMALPSAGIPPLRATAIVGLGSLVTLGTSVLTMKAFALLIGPDGVGVLALMQSVVNIGLIVTGLGVSTAVIGMIAGALGRDDAGAEGAITRAAAMLSLASGVVGGGVLWTLQEPVARVALGSQARSTDIVILALALIFATAGGAQIALLTGRHLVGTVTIVNVATAIFAAVVGIALVAAFGTPALAPTILVTYGAQLLLAAVFRRRVVSARVRWLAIRASAGSLLRRGLPITGSQLASTGITFLIPILVLQSLNAAEVGLYRGAAALSVGYLGFFVAGLVQDYLPRLGAAADDRARSILVERRMRIVLGLAVPVILALLAFGPWIVQWLYSAEFVRSYEVLKWQLVGDLLRLPAWVLTFVLIARGRGLTYLGVETLGGITLIIATLLGLSTLGLEGAGIGYLAAQAVYLAVVWLVVRRHAGTTPGRLQAVVVTAAAGCVALLALQAPELVRLAVFGIGAVVIAAVAWPRLYRLNASGAL